MDSISNTGKINCINVDGAMGKDQLFPYLSCFFFALFQNIPSSILLSSLIAIKPFRVMCVYFHRRKKKE